MSYILDALKKADAERTRGDVPDLHARQAVAAPAPRNTPQRTGVWLTLAAALVLGVLAIAVWEVRPPVAVVATTPAPVVQPPAPANAPASASGDVLPVSGERGTSATLVPAPAPAPPPVKAEPRMPTRPVAPTMASPKAASPTSAAIAPATPTTAPLLSELPIELRSQIPALAISGSVHSDNPSQRLLLVNGQVLHQGSPVAQDVILLEIRVGSSEFNFRGTRFRLAH